MNTQPLSKQEISENGRLALIDIFYTIQGEGPFAGTPAVFVRLAGCNLQCPMCDTDYTTGATFFSPHFIFDVIMDKLGSPNETPFLVVITGGEPFRQNITPLVEMLLKAGVQVQVETNGTLFLDHFPYDDVTIVCSPKTGSLNKLLQRYIDAYKYVITTNSISPVDGLPISALGHPVGDSGVARPLMGSKVFVQPVDTGDEKENNKHRQQAINSCMNFGYTLCLQIHKIINME